MSIGMHSGRSSRSYSLHNDNSEKKNENTRFGWLIEDECKYTLDNLAEARRKFEDGKNHVFFYSLYNGEFVLFEDGKENNDYVSAEEARDMFWSREYCAPFVHK